MRESRIINRITRIIILGVVCMFCCCHTKADENLYLSHPPLILSGQINQSIQNNEYYLGPYDIIKITVQDAPEFSYEPIKIPQDGMINLYLLGNITVTGMTLEDLRDLYKDALKEYFNKPEVIITLEETKSFIVYIAGAVVSPGSYELSTNVRDLNNNPDVITGIQPLRTSPILSNILISAGGVTYNADIENIEIKNHFTGKISRTNLLKLITEGDLSQDRYLSYGDTIYVPKLPTNFTVTDDLYGKYASSILSQKTIPIRVMGHVNNPGLVFLEPKYTLTVNSAIVAAGGYASSSPYPSQKVFLSRLDTNGKLVTTMINPTTDDPMLRPNDIVYIPEKPRSITGKAFEYATRVLTPFNIFADIYNSTALMFDPNRFNGAVTIK